MQRVAWSAVIVVGWAAVAGAQTAATAGRWSLDTGGGVGVGRVFRANDQGFGTAPAIVVGVAARHQRGFGLEADVGRLFGLEAAPAPCGIVAIPCAGQGRAGVLAAVTASVSVQYQFGRRRIRPYVSGGIAGLWTRSVWTTIRVGTDAATLTEEERRDTGFGPAFGGGLQVAIAGQHNARVDVQTLSGSARSAVNLATTRLSVGWMRRW